MHARALHVIFLLEGEILLTSARPNRTLASQGSGYPASKQRGCAPLLVLCTSGGSRWPSASFPPDPPSYINEAKPCRKGRRPAEAACCRVRAGNLKVVARRARPKVGGALALRKGGVADALGEFNRRARARKLLEIKSISAGC